MRSVVLLAAALIASGCCGPCPWRCESRQPVEPQSAAPPVASPPAAPPPAPQRVVVEVVQRPAEAKPAAAAGAPQLPISQGLSAASPALLPAQPAGLLPVAIAASPRYSLGFGILNLPIPFPRLIAEPQPASFVLPQLQPASLQLQPASYQLSALQLAPALPVCPPCPPCPPCTGQRMPAADAAALDELADRLRDLRRAMEKR